MKCHFEKWAFLNPRLIEWLPQTLFFKGCDTQMFLTKKKKKKRDLQELKGKLFLRVCVCVCARTLQLRAWNATWHETVTQSDRIWMSVSESARHTWTRAKKHSADFSRSTPPRTVSQFINSILGVGGGRRWETEATERREGREGEAGRRVESEPSRVQGGGGGGRDDGVMECWWPAEKRRRFLKV